MSPPTVLVGIVIILLITMLCACTRVSRVRVQNIELQPHTKNAFFLKKNR